jgi:hypothetical protein
VIKKLRRYALGRKFILRTDHKPLVGLFDEKRATREIENKQGLKNIDYKLSELEFTVEYVLGGKNNLADVLSRLKAYTARAE